MLIKSTEANSISTAFTPHPCTEIGQKACTEDGCGGTYSSDRYAGACDPDGCDFNSYRQGVQDFYGPGMTVDTTKKFTVVTQFIKGSSGDLASIKRFYVQGGKLIPNSESTIDGVTGNEINAEYCSAQKTAFGDTDDFNNKGGLAQMGKALAKGMVLVMSLWDDVSVYLTHTLSLSPLILDLYCMDMERRLTKLCLSV
jgi:cellulose 1,4-beta-cellobiosidase